MYEPEFERFLICIQARKILRTIEMNDHNIYFRTLVNVSCQRLQDVEWKKELCQSFVSNL